ncbi:hypothetical protein OJ996_17385 [Luteolibacter sp. GHJ8]|uniref:ABC transporter permease n=1 Tax=Luteolibacter rhizosphaerae TaxID=2989719 RepID=A0ABT3G7B0_9BACT|nr:hypothetical protein [Luteolibacter rhizosphaerae]MCW1915361.1 hypothetical protein [Luteolibacter rhizosphaerae]
MSTAAATAAPPPTVAPPRGGRFDDFSDKLSPMLVKELRQGLRARTFVVVFLSLQALLAVVLLGAVGANSPEKAGQVVSSVIFLFFSLAVLVVQPLRGIGALHNEIKGNTIDLMVLTRLGAWRIVLGKWVAIVSQSALLLTAIAPYLILRYFFGRMNLFAELLLLVLVFLGSAVFTAVTVGLSAIGPIIIRGLFPLGMGLLLIFGIFGIVFDDGLNEMIDFCTLQDKDEVWGLLAALLCGTYLAWTCLALGASMIAPMAENHSTSRRLMALATVVLTGILAWAADFQREQATVMLVLFCVPALSIALTESFQLLPPICRPFLRFGALGKVAGRVLYPGWPSGVMFTTLLLALGAFVVLVITPNSHYSAYHMDAQTSITILVFTGTLLLSAVFLRLLSSKVRQPFTFLILVVVALCVLTIGLGMIADKTENDEFLWLFCWLPPVKFLITDMIRSEYYAAIHSSGGSYASPDLSPVLVTGLITNGIYLLTLLTFAFRQFPAIARVEEEAENKPETSP